MFRSSLAIAAGALIALVSIAMPSMAAQNAPEPTEPQTATAAPLTSSNAQAFAFVGQGGAVIRSKGFGSVTHPDTGIVCLKLQWDLSLTGTVPVVSVEWGNSFGVVNFAQWDHGHGDCPGPAGRMIEVQTYKGDTAGVGSAYQIPVLSDQVAFVVLVP